MAVSLLLLFGTAGYFLLLFVSAKKLPPLVSAISISALVLLNLFQIVYAVQISKNADGIDLLLYVYHFNILLLSARAVHRHMRQQVAVFQERAAETVPQERFRKFFDRIDSLSKYTIFVFLILFFLVAVIEIVFVLAGQGLDAPVRAFTDTADWTFSKQTPPPPAEYKGHYLCTVAAGGHEKVVRPLRFGTRMGETIIVNRQLCIANAFEEVIQEKLPAFHRRVRRAYDTYGYPLSEVITEPWQADLVYVLMKPLEWLFLLFLYLVDLRPERRIQEQYEWNGER